MALAIMVDEARWWWRDRRWAHLASDADVEELHRFAGAMGLPRVSFGGDHYDVTEPQRLDALAAGALAVGSRELVRRLRDGGLRRPAGAGSHRWDRVAELAWPDVGVEAVLERRLGWAPPAAAARYLEQLAAAWGEGRALELRLLRRGDEVALLLSDPRGAGSAPAVVTLPDPVEPIVGHWAWPQSDGRLLEVFIRVGDVPKTSPGGS